MIKHRNALSWACVALAFLGGCGHRDVTADAKYGFGTLRGTTWRTRIPIVLAVEVDKKFLIAHICTNSKYIESFRMGTAENQYEGQPGQLIVAVFPPVPILNDIYYSYKCAR